MPNNLSNPFTWTRFYAKSYLGSLSRRDAFSRVKTFCMFLGYPRSGHSLVGSLLDAHPNMVIAHELDVLKFIQAGFSRNQIFYLLLQNSERYAEAGRKYSGYSYEVPKQWQGRFAELQVIGDKKGGRSSTRLGRNPRLLARLYDTIGMNIKWIHVVRNPYDSIGTMSRRDRRKQPLDKIIDNYFSRCAAVAAAKNEIGASDLIDLRQEALIAEPEKRLKELCDFLGLAAPADYLAACAGIIFRSPHKSRSGIAWTADAIARVRGEMARYPFFAGYTYED
jgi:hypothetical protein